jgi:hypothetical protein
MHEAFLFLRRIQLDIIVNVQAPSCKVPLFFSEFNKNPEIFSTEFLKILKYQMYKNLSSVSHVGPCRRTVRWTDRTKLIVAFCNFENVP